ncbi:gustatory receptor 8a-like isoform X2 [Bradysia coprophila]|uniref:gustatory receptor 8a-like isoform X2 n=1 Tax=Bradysia coprophila TaxID=38358 RepID=UPI00187D776D|nr:gustatory receptor 8a-like isoform X2 [Bradysia coprophila]
MIIGLSSATIMHSYLNYFQWLGLCPVVFSHSKQRNFRTLTVISFLHIIILSTMTILAYTYSHVIFFNDDSFGLFNDTIKFVAAVIAYYAIIIESFLKRGTQSRIWNLLAQCHQADRLDRIDQCKLWNPAQFNCYFFGYVGLMILTESYRMPFIFSKNQHLNYWPFLTILLIFTRSRHLQYIFYLNIVKRQLHLLFEELRRIDEYSRYNRTKLERTLQHTYDQFLCRRLYLAREYYSFIYEISTELNEAFGWSHLVNLTHSFVQILTDLYWCYWLSDNETYILSGDSAMTTIQSVVILILVFGYSTELHTKAKKTSFFVHSIRQMDCGSKIRDLIESFSLQLIHEPIIFRAQGCFNLDLSILGDATVAITTYMVFFIQFTPRYKS